MFGLTTDYWLDLTERKPVQSVTNGIGAALGHIRHSQIQKKYFESVFSKVKLLKIHLSKMQSVTNGIRAASNPTSDIHNFKAQAYTIT